MPTTRATDTRDELPDASEVAGTLGRRPAVPDTSTQPDGGAPTRAADDSLSERYAQLRASGLACDRW